MDERVARAFVEMADTLVAEFDLIDFLHVLAERCVELLDASAAGLLIADQRGALQLMAASTNQIRVLELFQLQEDAGPCLESFHTGQVVTIVDLSQASERWPRFVSQARELGVAAVHAIPMRLRAETIGTLNLFRNTPGSLDEPGARVARALVDVATIGILQERAVRQREVLAEQLQAALNSRVVIEQAKGVLAERVGITPDDAFVLMRGFARGHSRRLGDIAYEVITTPFVPSS